MGPIEPPIYTVVGLQHSREPRNSFRSPLGRRAPGAGQPQTWFPQLTSALADLGDRGFEPVRGSMPTSLPCGGSRLSGPLTVGLVGGEIYGALVWTRGPILRYDWRTIQAQDSGLMVLQGEWVVLYPSRQQSADLHCDGQGRNLLMRLVTNEAREPGYRASTP